MLYPPAGRRTKWAVIIPSCPVCGYMHAHSLDGFARVVVRAPSCRPWVTYEITASVVLPRAVTAA